MIKYFAWTRVIWIKKLGQWGKRERLMEFFRLKIAQEIVFFTHRCNCWTKEFEQQDWYLDLEFSFDANIWAHQLLLFFVRKIQNYTYKDYMDALLRGWKICCQIYKNTKCKISKKIFKYHQPDPVCLEPNCAAADQLVTKRAPVGADQTFFIPHVCKHKTVQTKWC